MSLTLTSPAFEDGEEIPDRYGYTAENVNPPLRVEHVPDGTASLVLIMDDPDAMEPAGKIWDHWLVWNIPPHTSQIEADDPLQEVVEGENDYGGRGYGGPNPPDGRHTYRFRLYALDTTLDIAPGTTKNELEDATDGHVIEETLLEGTYAP